MKKAWSGVNNQDNQKFKARNSTMSYIRLYTSRNIVVMLILGFSSGLPLPLTGGTLQAWLTMSGVDLRTIGIFSLVGLPYTLKFLWSPLMDRFVPPLARKKARLDDIDTGLSVVWNSMHEHYITAKRTSDACLNGVVYSIYVCISGHCN